MLCLCECRACRVRSLGRDARILRIGLGGCPFAIGDPDALSWVRGWTEEDQEVNEAAQALEHLTIRERVKK